MKGYARHFDRNGEIEAEWRTPVLEHDPFKINLTLEDLEALHPALEGTLTNHLELRGGETLQDALKRQRRSEAGSFLFCTERLIRNGLESQRGAQGKFFLGMKMLTTGGARELLDVLGSVPGNHPNAVDPALGLALAKLEVFLEQG